MSIEDLATTRGPSAAALRLLERLARRRTAIEAVTPAGEHRETVLGCLFATLDNMEEAVCEEGPRSRLLAEGWQRLDELEARLTETSSPPATPARERPEPPRPPSPPASIRRRRAPAKPTIEVNGGPDLINAIDTIRSVAHRAAEDPVPAAGDAPLRLGLLVRRTPARPSSQAPSASVRRSPRRSLPPASRRAGRPSPRAVLAPSGCGRLLLLYVDDLLTRLESSGTFDDHHTLLIVAQTLITFLPLLDLDPAAAGPDIPPEPTTREEARIDHLGQERDRRLRGPRANPWHELLDLTSEVLETCIRHRHLAGVRGCLELLDLLADAFTLERPEAA